MNKILTSVLHSDKVKPNNASQTTVKLRSQIMMTGVSEDILKNAGMLPKAKYVLLRR